MEKQGMLNSKTASGLLTVLILGVLVIAGPADASCDAFSEIKNEYTASEDIVFNLNSSGNFSIYLDDELICDSRESCKHVSVNNRYRFSYGYGYGYGYGYEYEYTHSIEIKHNFLKLGSHKLRFESEGVSETKEIDVLPAGILDKDRDLPRGIAKKI